MTEYTLKRSNRKTVAIHIIDGAVEVRAPLKMPKHDIDHFVVSKEKWIFGKLADSLERATQRENFRLGFGDEIIYRGKQYPILEKQGDRIGFDNKCFYMPPGLEPEQIKYACVQIYRLLAKRYLTEKTNEYAKRMSVTPVAVRINSAKTRWGSCSSKKSINYSWRLIMAGDDIIDYVVVHELAHISELNHSTRFWALVAGMLPDCNERRARLKELQRKLAVQDWDI